MRIPILSADEVTQIAESLQQTDLTPAALFTVGFIIGRSVAKETTSSRRVTP